MPMRLSSKELNVRKVKALLRDVNNNKLAKGDVARELNQRFDRMEKEDVPWFEDLYPKYIQVFKDKR